LVVKDAIRAALRTDRMLRQALLLIVLYHWIWFDVSFCVLALRHKGSLTQTPVCIGGVTVPASTDLWIACNSIVSINPDKLISSAVRC
jgi:hypothetical protein